MSGSDHSEHNSPAGSHVAPSSTVETSIIIVGAGLVGAVQALLFARAGFSVTVIEQKQLRDLVGQARVPADAISSRTVALSHRSWQLLSDAGLWPDIACCPIQTVHVTEQGNFGSVKLDANKLDVEALGYVISNAEFESYLHSLLRREANIQIYESAHVVSVENNMEFAGVTIERVGVRASVWESLQVSDQGGMQKKLTASLVVAADGTQSAVRQMLGIETKLRDYRQCAVLANVRTTRCHSNIAYERFTRDGPLALLPLSSAGEGNLYSMIYTAPGTLSAELTELSDKDFLSLLQKKFGGKLGRFEKIGKRYVTALTFTVSMHQSKGRFVLIGNAVRTLHPVAGQGMNLALRDVFELVSSVVDGKNIETALVHFERQRKRDQWLVTQQTDLLARMFTGKPWLLRLPVSLLTSSGFMLLDIIEPFKKAFATRSMGRHVPLSKVGRDLGKGMLSD